MDSSLREICQLPVNTSWLDFVWLAHSNVANPCTQAGLLWVLGFISFAVSIWQMLILNMWNGHDRHDFVSLTRKFRIWMTWVAIANGFILTCVGIAYCLAQFFLGVMKFLPMFESGMLSIAVLLRSLLLIKTQCSHLQIRPTIWSSQVGIWLLIAAILGVRTFGSFQYWHSGLSNWSTLDFAMDLTSGVLTLVFSLLSLALLIEFSLANREPNAEDENQLIEESENFVVLGCGDEKANLLSKLVFYWVNRLMLKGSKGQLSDVNELFQLPTDLNSRAIENKFVDAQVRHGNSLIRVLLHSFGVEYFS